MTILCRPSLNEHVQFRSLTQFHRVGDVIRKALVGQASCLSHQYHVSNPPSWSYVQEQVTRITIWNATHADS